MKLGQKVQWESQAGGNCRVKTGKIVEIVKKGFPPWKSAVISFPDHKRMFDGWRLPGGPKTKEAYFVEVIVGPKAKPRLYMPHPKNLVKIG